MHTGGQTRLALKAVAMGCCIVWGAAAGTSAWAWGSGQKGNPELSGTVFIGNARGPWLLDLRSGRYSKIPGLEWEHNSNFRKAAKFRAMPRPYGNEEFVETVFSCSKDSFNNKDCFFFRDFTGRVKSGFAIPDIAMGPGKPSRDGKFLAVRVDKPLGAVNIYTRQGKLVRTIRSAYKIQADQFDWLPNNELIFAAGQGIFRSDRRDSVVSVNKSSGLKPGVPVVSPDGKKIAFVIGQSTSYGVKGTLWTVSVDANSKQRPEQLTASDKGRSSIRHGAHAWSPDGKYLFMIDSSELPARPYAVPANGRSVVVSRTRRTQAMPILSGDIRAAQKGKKDAKGALKSTIHVHFDGMRWMPTVEVY